MEIYVYDNCIILNDIFVDENLVGILGNKMEKLFFLFIKN